MIRLLVATALAGAALAGAAPARAADRGALIDSTVRYLQERQGADGGFAELGGRPSPGISSWVVQALEGAGINPLDQSRCGTDAFTYLEVHFQEGLEEELAWPQISTTAFERELLMVDGAGADPHSFAGYDLVGEILSRQLPDGSFPYTPLGEQGESNDTIFAILALSPIHEAAIEAAIAAAREWVVGAQDEDGGWYFSGKSDASEVDMTGAALEALVVAGPPPDEPPVAGSPPNPGSPPGETPAGEGGPSEPQAGRSPLVAYEEAVRRGLDYMRHSQLPDGGFPAEPTHEAESNVASTAWAAQGIWATGGNPEDWRYGGAGPEPLGYMESMQQPDGHIRWRASSDLNGIWMTAYVTPAFAGQALPIPAAARGSAAATRGEAAACEEAGEGGSSPQPGPGVIAGGGGRRAPAFSRPRRGSKGKTPGGARFVHGEGLRARDHSGGNRRGGNLAQARGTETAEPRSAAEADQEVEAVAPGEPSAGAAPAAAAVGSSGEDGDDGSGPGARGVPLPKQRPPDEAPRGAGEEVSGAVLGAQDDGGGKLAFGAPGLRSAGAGSGEGPGLAIAIGAAVLLAAAIGLGWERRRGALA